MNNILDKYFKNYKIEYFIDYIFVDFSDEFYMRIDKSSHFNDHTYLEHYFNLISKLSDNQKKLFYLMYETHDLLYLYQKDDSIIKILNLYDDIILELIDAIDYLKNLNATDRDNNKITPITCELSYVLYLENITMTFCFPLFNNDILRNSLLYFNLSKEYIEKVMTIQNLKGENYEHIRWDYYK